MGTDLHNGEILTTWKEIAAYLKSGVRTCVRWEAKNGLPVHRQEGAPKSRIYAYKQELDDWFKSRLGNGTIVPIQEAGKASRLKYLFFSIPAVLLIAAGAFLILRDGKGMPEKKAATGVPESRGAMSMLAGDIVEGEFAADGIMRIWREKGDGTYFEAWRIEPVRHTSLVIGNVDLEPDLEVVAPGHCRETYEKEGQAATRIRFFLNAYKIDFKNWWKTTYYDQARCVFEKDNYEFTEIAVGNIDGGPENEIVLVTAHALSVFRYDPAVGEFKLVCSKDSFPENVRPLFRSLRLVDADNDGKPEILATANEGEEANVTENKGWLFVLGMKNNRLEVRQVVPLPGISSVHSLREGDIIPGGPKEIIFPLCKKEKGLWFSSIVGWNATGGFVFEKSIDELGSSRASMVFLDVGDLISANPGDEIVVARHDPNELLAYTWDGANLAAGPKYPLDHRLRISGVQVGGSKKDPRRQASVLVYGGSDEEDHAGRFYLERVNFTGGFYQGWRRSGGENGELPISFASYALNFQE